MSKDLSTYNLIHYGNASNKRENIGNDISLLYDLTEPADFHPDTDKAWQKIKGQIKQKRNNYWLKIAAMVIVMFGIGIITYSNFFQNDNLIMVSSGEMVKHIILPDGSSIILNANSTLQYPEEFGRKRLVSLRGEGYFDVEKSSKQFRIEVGDNSVTVLGTEFNVKQTSELISVIVTSGKVQFGNSARSIKLSAGQEGKILIDQQDLLLNHHPDLNQIAWATGRFDFKNTNISDVIVTLESHFKTTINLSSASIGKCEITGSFESNSVEEILQSICTVLDLKLEFKKKQYTLKGKGC